MKYLKQMVAGIAAISVTVFWSSLFTVAASNGLNAVAAEICAYSLVASFVSLVFYFPETRTRKLV